MSNPKKGKGPKSKRGKDNSNGTKVATGRTKPRKDKKQS
jgi:hypothetical protein